MLCREFLFFYLATSFDLAPTCVLWLAAHKDGGRRCLTRVVLFALGTSK